MKLFGVYIGPNWRKEYGLHKSAQKAAAEWFAQTYGRSAYTPNEVVSVAKQYGYSIKVTAETE